MDELVIDIECTINNTGDPFDQTNKLCYIGSLNSSGYSLVDIEYSSSPYGSELRNIQKSISNVTTLVGFNIKFDLHWLRRYGIDFSQSKIWDCQLVHFILTNQAFPYPSLNGVAHHYGLESKLDIVATEYWDKGIDTPLVPKDILEDYLLQDLKLTHQIYLLQKEEVAKCSEALQRLILLHNADLLVLQEMEYNGIIYNERKCLENADTLEIEIKQLDSQLAGASPIRDFNFNSGDHLSCLLYGGSINFPTKVVSGAYKTGPKKGKPKETWVDYYHIFPQLVEPLKGSALQKEGFYSTDEQTLKSLKASKEARIIIDILLTRSLLEKRRGTYFAGLPKLRKAHYWKENYLHGQLNQCVARTGRLSSSKPNLQNIDGQIKDLFHTRY